MKPEDQLSNFELPSTATAAAALNVDADEDDAEDEPSPLPLHVRFNDLRRARIVKTRKHLAELQKKYGFPIGIMIGPNSRAWTYSSIMTWLKNRPTALKAMPVNAHRPKGKKKTNKAAE